ncbi:hypothetical protein GOP47_0010193 [Adiantum capillus-veneris]|uniref:RING-type E3 ubiquitin transferase n=1 Tax=Adiantum capillus-veneris TaxID=13818 RepID=A0A9D4UVI7_ADICA|nr:hypothetical protein GOP47_0010193 [Adiantum capillus-veneris]
MEECCVVCAEPLEWIAYGICGHRDVCSRCIARLRFVLNDKRCCICKQECSSVFVTKALGNYTKVIHDFEILHKSGDFWYEKNTQAFFDSKDHFAMVKAMCRLSCGVCEQADRSDLDKDFVKKGHIFKNLDLLQRHLLSVHQVQMCGLCLEGRKIFICDQKLYNKGQLVRHSAEGDSDIDGIGEERGGFTGHPLCSFCQKRFYSEHELYQHMSVDHYLCHICQRLHPGHYDYFRNYDDLEVHFRHEHSLCEDPDCLAKKFVVFKTETELKRHNAVTHGGNMSRSQRNTYLQIPVSFQYRRPPIFGHESSNRRNPTNFGNYENREPLANTGYSNTEGNAAELSDPRSKSTRRKTKQRVRRSSTSANGTLQGSETTSVSSSSWHRATEDSPCSTNVGTANVLNRQLQDPGEEACSKGMLTDEVRSANKALGESIRSRLGDDVELFTAFKDLSAKFRKGILDVIYYCKHIKELGLWDLVPELARLCPEPERQKALVNAFEVDSKGKRLVAAEETQLQLGRNVNVYYSNDPEKGRGKVEADEGAAYSTANLMAALRLRDRGGTYAEENYEERHFTNGYCESEGRPRAILNDASSSSTNHDSKPEVVLVNGRLPIDIPDQTATSHATNTWSCGVCTLENSELKIKCAACENSRPTAVASRLTEVAERHTKRKKKVSKFERLRIDEESLPCPPLQLPEPVQKKKSGGVWKNGGGQRLVALAQREAVIDSAWRR